MAYETKGSTAFKKVQEFKRENDVTDHSIMELILLYCQTKEIDPTEFGEELKRDKNFREMFKADLLFHNEAVFEDNKKVTVSEWI